MILFSSFAFLNASSPHGYLKSEEGTLLKWSAKTSYVTSSGMSLCDVYNINIHAI